MGTSRDFPELSGKLVTAAARMQAQQVRTMAEIAAQMERDHLAIVASALNGKPSFSGWPTAPLAGQAIPDGMGGLRFVPSPVSRASERVAESGRHPNGGTGIKGRHWNGTTRGKGTWTKTMEEFRVTIPPKVLAGYEKVMVEVFGGP